MQLVFKCTHKSQSMWFCTLFHSAHNNLCNQLQLKHFSRGSFFSFRMPLKIQYKNNYCLHKVKNRYAASLFLPFGEKFMIKMEELEKFEQIYEKKPT